MALPGQQVVTTCRLAEAAQKKMKGNAELLTLAQKSSESKEKQEMGSQYQGNHENS